MGSKQQDQNQQAGHSQSQQGQQGQQSPRGSQPDVTRTGLNREHTTARDQQQQDAGRKGSAQHGGANDRNHGNDMSVDESGDFTDRHIRGEK